MISATKYAIDEKGVIRLFDIAGIPGAGNVEPMTAGEFNSVFSVTAGGKNYAVKIAPAENESVLTYEHVMMEQEVYYYSLMREKTSIHVPEVYYSDFTCEDIPVPFFIMEKLSGCQLDKAGLSKEEKALADKMLAGMVADMHSVKGEKFGYRQNELFDTWHGALHSMCANRISDGEKLGHKPKRGERLLALIDNNKDELNKADCSLTNFDIWAPNIICERENGTLRLSWIDPERCFFGDRIADFLCLDLMKLSLDKKTDVINSYNAASSQPVTVTDNERIRFAVMVGYIALIQDVEKYARYNVKNFGYWRNVISSNIFYSKCFSLLKDLMK